MILIYIIVALIVIAILNKVIEQAFKIQNKSKKEVKRSKTLISLVQNVVKYIVWFIVLTTILSKFGISVEGVIASAGVVGVAVGFGAQTIVKDIITGFFIIFENQFDVGDYVKINSGGTTVAEGTVKSIGLRSTRINTISGELTILPNGSMGEITNFSITNGTSIVQLPVSVDENLDQVEKKLNKLFTSYAVNTIYLLVTQWSMVSMQLRTIKQSFVFLQRRFQEKVLQVPVLLEKKRKECLCKRAYVCLNRYLHSTMRLKVKTSYHWR